MLALHILAGIVSLVAGLIALYAGKGAWLHRKSGTVFAWAMLLMTALGAGMALTTHPNRVNVVAGTITFYLVATGLLTVIRTVEQSRRLTTALAILGGIATARAIELGMLASAQPGGKVDHIPAMAIFMFALVGCIGVAGDLRVLRATAIQGVARLRRHLWRMTYALWIASTSAFLGQGKFLPAWIKDTGLHVLPVLLVLATLGFWLIRLRVRPRTFAPLAQAPKA